MDQKRAIAKGVELLSREPEALVQQMHEASRKLLNEKIDFTAFLTWFVENYPESVEETKKADAKFWDRFR